MRVVYGLSLILFCRNSEVAQCTYDVTGRTTPIRRTRALRVACTEPSFESDRWTRRHRRLLAVNRLGRWHRRCSRSDSFFAGRRQKESSRWLLDLGDNGRRNDKAGASMDVNRSWQRYGGQHHRRLVPSVHGRCHLSTHMVPASLSASIRLSTGSIRRPAGWLPCLRGYR